MERSLWLVIGILAVCLILVVFLAGYFGLLSIGFYGGRFGVLKAEEQANGDIVLSCLICDSIEVNRVKGAGGSCQCSCLTTEFGGQNNGTCLCGEYTSYCTSEYLTVYYEIQSPYRQVLEKVISNPSYYEITECTLDVPNKFKFLQCKRPTTDGYSAFQVFGCYNNYGNPLYVQERATPYTLVIYKYVGPPQELPPGYCGDEYCQAYSGEDCSTCPRDCGICPGPNICGGTDTSCGSYPDCVDCNAQDGYVGSNFCYDNDVYRAYRDYYCSGTSCSYNSINNKITECGTLGCNTATNACNAGPISGELTLLFIGAIGAIAIIGIAAVALLI